jgi:Flp pilus assembly pilin Flp
MDSRNFPLAKAHALLSDEEGFVITIELILIATIVGIGSIVGLTTLRNAINSELADVSDAIESMEWGDSDSESSSSSVRAANSCISYSVPPSDEA